MNRFVPKELLATFGLDGFGPLCGVYAFSLGPALLVGSSSFPGSAPLAVGVWICGALIIVLRAGFCLSRFKSDAHELLLPAYKHMLLRSLCWLLSVILLLPSLLFWRLVPGAHHGILLILVAPLGLLLAMLLRRTRFEDRSRQTHVSGMWQYSARSPSQVIGMFMGRLFASVPAEPRTLGFVALGMVLWGTPLWLMLISARPPWSNLALAYVLLTVILSWIWLAIGLARFSRHRFGAFAELALLPGLGNAASQRHALYSAALTRPLLVVACGLTAYMLAVWPTWHSPARLVRLGLGSAILLMFCACGIFQLLNIKTAVTTRVAVLTQVVIPLTLAPTLLLTFPSPALFSHPGGHRFFFIFLLILTTVPLSMIWIDTWRVARLPHPFLETTS